MSKQAQQSAAQGANDTSSLIATANAVFGKGVREFPLNDGFKVEIRTANLGSLGVIVKVFSRLMEQFNEAQMRQLVDLAAEAQMLAIAQGQDPKNVSIDYNQLVGKAFNSGRVIETIFLGILTEVPELFKTFTNIPEDRVYKLDLDEGILIMGGIFVANYGFFTQRVLPILTSIGTRVARASLVEGKQSPKPAPAQKPEPKEAKPESPSKKSETE